MEVSKYTISAEDLYFFDLNGYLIVKNVLSSEQVNELNQALDHHINQVRAYDDVAPQTLRGKERLDLYGMIQWPSPWGDPFRRLLAHPVIVSRLNTLCGKGFRLDKDPFMISMNEGTAGLALHGAGEPFPVSNAYIQQNGGMVARGIIVLWQLYDVNPGDGGFVLIPGSHKARFPLPDGFVAMEDDMGMVFQPVMQAGDVLFFSGAATHGTRPWCSKNPRRSLLYKYSARTVARVGGTLYRPERLYGEWTLNLPPEQRAVLYGPGHYYDEAGKRLRPPRLESDGKQTRIVTR